MTVAYVSMPGTSGNYVSTADVNLLDADTAHCYQSYGLWSAGTNLNSGSRTKIAVAEAWSGYGFRVASSGAAGNQYVSPYPYPAIVSPATEYSYSVKLKISEDLVSPKVDLRMRWRNAADGFISQSIGTAYTGPYTAGDMVTLTATGTSPALAAKIEAWVFFDYGGGANTVISVGETLTVFDAVIRTGADASFVPSLRIVGDIQYTAKALKPVWAEGRDQWLMGRFPAATGGYGIRLFSNNTLFSYVYDSGGTPGVRTFNMGTTAALGLVDGQAYEFDVEWVVGGNRTFRLDGVQVLQQASAVVGPLAGWTTGNPFTVGALEVGTSNWLGDIYWAEVRDGIDGPVVRRFDADDLIGLV